MFVTSCKTVGGATTSYHRDGSGVTAPLISDSGATYTPGISERRNGVSTFLNAGLKDVAKQTDISGNVTATRKYDAYGMVIGSTGTWKGPFGYSGSAGYQEDETGLQLLGHRYYDSSTGRFITRDPIKDGRNWYAYCDNNPVSRLDADGLRWSLTAVLVADDADASDEVLDAALAQLDHSLNNWWRHFKDRNRKFWLWVLAAGAGSTAPLWSADKPDQYAREGARKKTTLWRRASTEAGRRGGKVGRAIGNLMKPVARAAKRSVVSRGVGATVIRAGVVGVVYAEAFLAIGAGFDTMRDPLLDELELTDPMKTPTHSMRFIR